MTENQKKLLEQQLWNVANQLRGKMHADEFRDYCLGFIFLKYLSELMHRHANGILSEDGIDFVEIDEATEDGQEMLAAIREDSVTQLGYFLKPSQLFGSLAKRGEDPDEFILNDQQTCFHSSIGVHIEKMIFKLNDWFSWKKSISLIFQSNKKSPFFWRRLATKSVPCAASASCCKPISAA